MDETFSVYLPPDRRQALIEGKELPDRTVGAALFADVSGFTPLTEALARALGPRRGAEELTQHLNRVYDALVAEVDRHAGSVLTFSGDSIICWFDGDEGLAATACGLAMQEAMEPFATLPTSTGETVELAVKVAVASGPARRFVVGDPEIQLFDVLAGETLVRMDVGEHLAGQGEVVLDVESVTRLGEQVAVVEWRSAQESGTRFALVEALRTDSSPNGSERDEPILSEAQARPWLLEPVYERLRSRRGEFLTELRPAVALFARFTGIDYDADEAAGAKLDAYIRWVQRVLVRYEGHLLGITFGDKGSYLYAAFGAPIAHEDDARRAAAAALELRTLPSELDFVQAVQIGISQGVMRTGSYGGRTRRTYSLLGDEMNLAARLMQQAASGQILVSPQAQQPIAHAFE